MGFDADFFQSGDPLTGRPTSESVKLRSRLASQNVGQAVAVLKGLTDGSAVLEGRNLEGIFDHIDVFAGHKENEETNNDKDGGTVGTNTDANQGQIEAEGASFLEVLDAGNGIANTEEAD